MFVMTVTTMIGSATLFTFSPVTVMGTPPLQIMYRYIKTIKTVNDDRYRPVTVISTHSLKLM